MIILGIDPGLAKMGFGVIKKEGKIKSKKKFSCLDYGLIQTSPLLATPERLKKISNELGKLIVRHKPGAMVIENVYFFKNLKTALPVSQAKGVILLAAAKKKIPVFEFTPLEMKMALTGYGRAEKKQVQEEIKKILGLKEYKEYRGDDADDALGMALCYFLKPKEEYKIESA